MGTITPPLSPAQPPVTFFNVALSPWTLAPLTVMVGASVEVRAAAISHVSMVVVSPPSLLKLILLELDVWPRLSQTGVSAVPTFTLPEFNRNCLTPAVGMVVLAVAVNTVPRAA